MLFQTPGQGLSIHYADGYKAKTKRAKPHSFVLFNLEILNIQSDIWESFLINPLAEIPKYYHHMNLRGPADPL